MDLKLKVTQTLASPIFNEEEKIKLGCQSCACYGVLHLSHLMGKPTICIGENKDTDRLRGNRKADQRLCFRYSDSTIPLLLKSEISSF